MSISSPISDDYGARAENVETIANWHANHASASNYIPTTFFIFPLLAMIFICSAVYYYNESKENNRMYRIKRILKGNDRYGKRVVKYELQNELVVSAMFCLHVIILSILGVVYTLDIDKHLNKHVKDYFSIKNLNKSLEYTASLAITTLSLDLLVIVVLLVFVKVVVQVKRTEYIPDADIISLRSWRYWAYSVVFPLCLIVNHSNYIIIAFVHDVYHAIAVAIIYGVVIAVLFGV